MDKTVQVLKIAVIILGFICTTLIPTIMGLVDAVKKRKAAETEAAKQSATNDMLGYLNTLIESAEELYKDVQSAGKLRKEDVLSRLYSYALTKGYEYDEEYWSKKNDEIVALTKKVNAPTK